MVALSHFVPEDDPWAEILKDAPLPDESRCVLLWVQRAKRSTENRAANLAVKMANALKLPVVALFVMTPDYPDAGARQYQFMAEGLAELPEAFENRNIAWALRLGDPPSVVPAVAKELQAAVVVTDVDPLRVASGWKSSAAERLDIPMVAVATDTLVPPSAFPTLEYAARTIRPKLWKMVAAQPELLQAIPTTRAKAPLLKVDPGPDPLAAVKTLKLDAGPASTDLRGGASEAQAALKAFISRRLDTYADIRNKPNEDQTSRLSAYLHFGQISPLAAVCAAITARVDDAPWEAPKGKATIGQGHVVVDEPLQSFLDELVTQRELAVNFCLREPAYDAWEGLPEWGQKTLHEHLDDDRPAHYSAKQLESGDTGDALWNAAQRQMVAQGYMPNRLRMYWAKQLLYWRKHPEDAMELAIDLNDRYELDGRDANGYANIAWAIGGRHDRPFPPRKPVLGLIRPLSARGLARSFDTDAYIAGVEDLTGEAVPGERPSR